MNVTSDRLLSALGLVATGCEEWVQSGIFARGVLVRFRQWLRGLPPERENLALSIARIAAHTGTNSGAVVNGIALDEKSKPSVESLLIFYAGLDPLLFPADLVQIATEKLRVHGGPRYTGPWP
jgi:hypothetical protein